MFLNILAIIASYFLGAIPWAYVCGKVFAGVNIMKMGSGNVGTTNTFRVLGWKLGILVFILDIAKGYFSAYLGFLAGGITLGVLCGFMALFAHTFSVFIKFKGGKGVATGAGVLLFLSPMALLCCFLVWLALALTTGYISVASIGAAFFSTFFVIIFDGAPLLCIFIGIAALYVILKHTANIKRLLKGTESKVNWREKIKPKS
ncbi:MAG: glycerol-3-phosphate 1-O-acyltransferase PlsY [Clostridiales bacterium]